MASDPYRFSLAWLNWSLWWFCRWTQRYGWGQWSADVLPTRKSLKPLSDLSAIDGMTLHVNLFVSQDSLLLHGQENLSRKQRTIVNRLLWKHSSPCQKFQWKTLKYPYILADEWEHSSRCTNRPGHSSVCLWKQRLMGLAVQQIPETSEKRRSMQQEKKCRFVLHVLKNRVMWLLKPLWPAVMSKQDSNQNLIFCSSINLVDTLV